MTGKFTYGNHTLSYANAEESLLANLTPPLYKYSYNQIVSRNNTTQSYILALPLGTLCARCVTLFLCISTFINYNQIKIYLA